MPNIFNANIAQLMNKHMGPMVFPLILKKMTSQKDPANITRTIQVLVEHGGKGFVDDDSLKYRSGTASQYSARVIGILGASLPAGIIPEPGDLIFIEGEDHTIAEKGVVRDPAGAMYECVTE
tara:strand:- start:21 stop:386 length:366 start_codon:yes stop_codon:yes gene_type:complete